MKREPLHRLPELPIDRSSREPLLRQVYGALRRAIASGELAPGLRLPSTRALAKRLGVSRNTVLDAYEALTFEGFLEGRIGSGTRVRGARRPPPRIPDPAIFLRKAQFPMNASALNDPDGNAIYLSGP